MGNHLSLTTSTASTVAIDAYISELQTVQYDRNLGTSRFLKTVRGTSELGQVVVKVFVKTDQQQRLSNWVKVLIKQRDLLATVENALPYTRFLETDRAGYLVRPYIKTNLYDRISTRPFLDPIEKIWIVYQLLKCLERCHDLHVYHGDIKSENILVTSWNWIYLSDFASFKPVFIPENDPSQFSFYFDTSQRRSCYIAPERFTADGGSPESTNIGLTSQMDIFSLGCVIAELFLEGSNIFTLAQLFKYKKGEYRPNLAGIENKHIREMVQSMISLDPTKRYSARQYIETWKEKLFPKYFYTFLHDFMATLSTPSPYDSINKNINIQKVLDKRMSYIYDNLEEIVNTLGFGKLLTKNETADALEISGIRFLLKPDQSLLDTSNDDGALIILNVVLATIRHVSTSGLKFKGCNLILAFSLMVNDEAKLDRCLPYLLAMMDDQSEVVQMQAIRNMTQLLGLVQVIAPINGEIFSEYIFPKLDMILRSPSSLTGERRQNNDNNNINSNNNNNKKSSESDKSTEVSVVRIVYASCLSKLATIASRFLEMSQILKTSGMLDSFDPETENGARQGVAPFDLNRQGLIDKFEEHTIALLSDTDKFVRKALLNDIFPLCLFFGKQKTNDVILSHIMTYLNDSDSSLSRQFFDCIIALGPYIGSTALEQYIQPLMLQALSNPEEFVTAKVFETYTSFAELGLIKRHRVPELIKLSIRCTIHPNSWIRLAAFEFISKSIGWASPAETYCIIYPIIRPFLQVDITDFSQASLVSNGIRPLSRPLFNLAIRWVKKAGKSLFWKAVSNSDLTQLPAKFRDIKVSSEDQIWIQELREMGADDSDLWKIAAFREHLYKLGRTVNSTPHFEVKPIEGEKKRQGTREVDLIKLESLGVQPRTFVFNEDYEYKPENQTLSVAVNEANPVMDITVGENGARVESAATTGTVTTDVYGTVEQPFAQISEKSELEKIHETDPYLSKLLDSTCFTHFPPQPSYYGPQVIPVTHTDQSHNLAGSKPNWQPVGVLASQFTDHKSAVNKIEATPDHSFFLTCSDDGTVKIWDCFRLEKNVINRSIQTYKPQGEEKLPAAKFLSFLENLYVFAVSYANGLVEFVRIDVALTKNESRVRFRRFVPVGRYMLNSDEHATWMKHTKIDKSSLLIMSTTKGRIIGLDVNTLEEKFEFKSPAAHGIPMCFVIDTDKAWMLVGSLQGVLDLYDLRFLILAKTWTFQNAKAIRRLCLYPKSKELLFCMLGGTSLSETSVWDIRTMKCKEVYSASGTVDPYKSYRAIPFDESNSEINVTKTDDPILLSMAVEVDAPKEIDKHIYLIAGGTDKQLRFWDTNSLENCMVISGGDNTPNSPQFFQSYNMANVKIIGQKNVISGHVGGSNSSSRFKPTRTNIIATEQQELARNHQATITDVIVIYKPYEMIVSADRLGVVKVFM